MKKILLSFALFAVAGAAYVGIKASTTNHESSLLLQNIEAVAYQESDKDGSYRCCKPYTFTSCAIEGGVLLPGVKKAYSEECEQ